MVVEWVTAKHDPISWFMIRIWDENPLVHIYYTEKGDVVGVYVSIKTEMFEHYHLGLNPVNMSSGAYFMLSYYNKFHKSIVNGETKYPFPEAIKPQLVEAIDYLLLLPTNRKACLGEFYDELVKKAKQFILDYQID